MFSSRFAITMSPFIFVKKWARRYWRRANLFASGCRSGSGQGRGLRSDGGRNHQTRGFDQGHCGNGLLERNGVRHRGASEEPMTESSDGGRRYMERVIKGVTSCESASSD